jgi:hypothetical protein
VDVWDQRDAIYYTPVSRVCKSSVTIHVPDEIAQRLQAQWGDVPRHVLESLVIEGFRSQILTTEDVRQLLGFETRFEVHAFFKQHEVLFYTLADLDHGRETSQRLGP